MSQPEPPVEPAPAATLLLLRDEPSFQVLMVERHAATTFGPGALVFPGGRLDDQDGDPAWEACVDDWDAFTHLQRALRICAVRETFEETGMVMAAAPPGAGPGDGARSLRSGRTAGTFRETVASAGLVLDLGALTQFARWVAPKGLVRRFDATFFVAHAPQGQTPRCDGSEIVGAEWIEPWRALQLADAGERKLMVPTLMNLILLAESEGSEQAIAAARLRPLDPVRPTGPSPAIA